MYSSLRRANKLQYPVYPCIFCIAFFNDLTLVVASRVSSSKINAMQLCNCALRFVFIKWICVFLNSLQVEQRNKLFASIQFRTNCWLCIAALHWKLKCWRNLCLMGSRQLLPSFFRYLCKKFFSNVWHFSLIKFFSVFCSLKAFPSLKVIRSSWSVIKTFF